MIYHPWFQIVATILFAAIPAACAHKDARNPASADRIPASAFNADEGRIERCRKDLEANPASKNEATWAQSLWASCIVEGVNPSEVITDWDGGRARVEAACTFHLAQVNRTIASTINTKENSSPTESPTESDIKAVRENCRAYRERCNEALQPLAKELPLCRGGA